jgi:hypothetical protein
MGISVGRIFVFFGFTGRKFYPRAAAAREVFVGRPVPARSQNISARPAGRARGNRAARNSPRLLTSSPNIDFSNLFVILFQLSSVVHM